MRVEGANERVKVAIVVGDLCFRADGRVCVFDRPKLPERADDLRLPPNLIVVLTVDRRRRHRSLGYGGCRG